MLDYVHSLIHAKNNPSLKDLFFERCYSIFSHFSRFGVEHFFITRLLTRINSFKYAHVNVCLLFHHASVTFHPLCKKVRHIWLF